MASQAQAVQLQDDQPVQQGLEAPQWSLATRVIFRFCFVYFTLFCVSNQILQCLFPVPKIDIPELSTVWPMRQLTFWTAAHVFRITQPLTYKGSGSGDKTFDWVLAFWLLVFSALAVLIWSVLDRNRQNYGALHRWFWVVIRFALAGQMFVYGMDKVFPLQMPYPSLSRLLEPFGNFSPMGVLWASIGASPAYEIFAGSAEMLGGILLIFPRTATFGALVCLADMIQVFMLNMTYDVPVKQLSFHLILLSLFVLAPRLQRVVSFFFLNRAVEPCTPPKLFRTKRANRIALASQIIFGLALIGLNSYDAVTSWHARGGGGPKSPLYGIWNVDQLSIDGQVRAPLLTDLDRWRRVLFGAPSRMSFQRMDDSLVSYSTSINVQDGTLILTKDSDKNWKAAFTFQRPAQDRLTLDGSIDGHRLHMQLALVDRAKFQLVQSHFRWIQETPFNR
jgi:uncharacterized membrane protein YphA (DoxX/SURF4 family)